MSSLMLHNPKFESKLTTLDALRGLPEPLALGPMHKPIAHAVLVQALRAEAERRGYVVSAQQLALGAKGAALFGVMDLVLRQSSALEDGARGMSLGFRNSIDQSMGIRAVAGSRVFVCDNLVLSGEMFAISRKNTTGLDLGDAVAHGFDKFLTQTQILDLAITRMAATGISDGRAKQTIFDVFAAHVIPVRLFDDVERFYFHPTDQQPDCQARTLWGLHNAFTRAMKDLSPVRLFGATVQLGHAFGMTAGNVIDVEAESVS